jgi:hypothetical protein
MSGPWDGIIGVPIDGPGAEPGGTIGVPIDGPPIPGPGGAMGDGLGWASALPQLRQNFMPGGLSPWQTEHGAGNPGGGAGVGA